MSVYRSILEEDLDLGGVLDDDNSVELQQIEDIVADQDANADEQDDAQAAEFGPSDGVDDILDETYMAIAESDMNFNKIMQAIGIYELSESAAGRDVIYEAGSIKSFFKRAKEAIVKFFGKVWQTLKRFAANIGSAFRTNSSFAKKYAKQIEAGYTAYWNNKDARKLKGYTFDGLDKFLGDISEDALKGEIGTAMDSVSDADKNMSADDYEAKVRKYREKLCGTACSADDFRETLRTKLYGSKEKKEYRMSAADVIAALDKDGKKAVEDCKKAMDGAKKEYSKAIQKLNKLERSAGKGENPDNAVVSACIRKVDMLKKALAATQVARATMLSASRARMAQARMYGQAYVAASNRANPKYKGFQKESASYGFLSDIELV